MLEVGAGSGMWVPLLRDFTTPDGDGPRIKRILGVEPNPTSILALRKRIAHLDMESVYEIVPTGIESLIATGSVSPGSVDCVVAVMCLCSVPDPERNIRELWRMLRPGGRFYVYEHVCCEAGWAMGLYQREFFLFFFVLILMF